MKSGRSDLVAVFAHPDDETFGLGGIMARATDAGATVTVICATRGEVGEISHPSLATRDTLGEVRERELRTACRELGVTDVRFMGYRDSGMAGSPENDDLSAHATQMGPNHPIDRMPVEWRDRLLGVEWLILGRQAKGTVERNPRLPI